MWASLQGAFGSPGAEDRAGAGGQKQPPDQSDNTTTTTTTTTTIEQRNKGIEYLVAMNAMSNEQWLENTLEGQLTDHYNISQNIGSGAFSAIYLGNRKKDNQRVALKYIPKRKAFGAMSIKFEVTALKVLSPHVNITQFYGLFSTVDSYVVSMEYVKGGDLLDILVNRIEAGIDPYTEAEAAVIMQQIIGSVVHCHRKGILHRDLKPENFLVSNESSLGNHKGMLRSPVKLADFGLACTFREGDKQKAVCGTASYMAPERLSRTYYDDSSDVWSIGVVMFSLIGANFPFPGNNMNEMLENVNNPKLPEYKDLGNASKDCVDLIKNQLLVNDPEKRISLEELAVHPWVTGVKASMMEIPGIVTAMRRFNAKRKLRIGITKVLAQNRMVHILKQLKIEKAMLDLTKYADFDAQKIRTIWQHLMMSFNQTGNEIIEGVGQGEGAAGVDSSNSYSRSRALVISRDSFKFSFKEVCASIPDRIVSQIFDCFAHEAKRVNVNDICVALMAKVATNKRECLGFVYNVFNMKHGCDEMDMNTYKYTIRSMIDACHDIADIPLEAQLDKEFKDLTKNKKCIDLHTFVQLASNNRIIVKYMDRMHSMLGKVEFQGSVDNIIIKRRKSFYDPDKNQTSVENSNESSNSNITTNTSADTTINTITAYNPTVGVEQHKGPSECILPKMLASLKDSTSSVKSCSGTVEGNDSAGCHNPFDISFFNQLKTIKSTSHPNNPSTVSFNQMVDVLNQGDSGKRKNHNLEKRESSKIFKEGEVLDVINDLNPTPAKAKSLTPLAAENLLLFDTKVKDTAKSELNFS